MRKNFNSSSAKQVPDLTQLLPHDAVEYGGPGPYQSALMKKNPLKVQQYALSKAYYDKYGFKMLSSSSSSANGGGSGGHSSSDDQ